MKKETEATVEILSILNEFDPPKRIEIIERIGKRVRQANSINSAQEVRAFAVKNGLAKKVDHYPINGELKNG